mmetsp:Transcript_45719/g.131093  ORF Transcript_45719/g.131093 Transcript_45719/m.131093 type:complete len:232 (-) Transcript_45719:1664-2359(-)
MPSSKQQIPSRTSLNLCGWFNASRPWRAAPMTCDPPPWSSTATSAASPRAEMVALCVVSTAPSLSQAMYASEAGLAQTGARTSTRRPGKYLGERDMASQPLGSAAQRPHHKSTSMSAASRLGDSSGSALKSPEGAAAYRSASRPSAAASRSRSTAAASALTLSVSERAIAASCISSARTTFRCSTTRAPPVVCASRSSRRFSSTPSALGSTQPKNLAILAWMGPPTTGWVP